VQPKAKQPNSASKPHLDTAINSSFPCLQKEGFLRQIDEPFTTQLMPGDKSNAYIPLDDFVELENNRIVDSSSTEQKARLQSDIKSKSSNKSPSMLFFIGFLLLLIGIGIGYVLSSLNNSERAINTPKNISVTSETRQLTSAPTASPTLSVSSHSTEVQKTYSNSTYGITFMYPNDGIVDDNPANGDYVISVNTKNLAPLLHMHIHNSRDDIVRTNEFDKWYALSFHVYNNPQNIPLESIATDINAYGAKNNFTITELVSIDGVKGILGIWQSSDTGEAKVAVYNRGGKTYIFEMTGDNGYYSAAGEKILTAILNSAHFTK
jgi:hypothetical protein